ncbi:IS256 family transposase [Pedobacter sp. BS3]|uniref:IS256 family transposase n=1 Tax=Pedobacter sp. BS3 TaxID=2567937 RepID=UPI0011EE2561|nr:IS256 family transposase [Pedobacter sp. BS3]TZF84079.1 IS256 family transposase [Pedobacter sp. BS3]
METPDNFDFESFKKEAMAGLSAGKKMTGSEGVLAPLMKHFLESMMAGELEHHLSESRRQEQPNRRNGKSRKTVRSLNAGEFELETGRDRLSTFDPKIVPKRQLIITEELEGNILSMYARGMSTRAMRDYIQEMYAMEISPAEISRITDSVLPAVQEWRSRPLEAVYPFVFLDCMFFKVRTNGSVETRAVYNILGVNIEGRKEVLGLYTSENEGAKFWLSVLTDLKARGVEDMLIACIDGLKGFPEAVEAVFPQTRVQLCIVHQIRSSMRYVPEKDKKAVMADLKPVYQAASEQQGYEKLLEFEEKRGRKYPLSCKSWLDNWVNLSAFFEYDPVIRKVIYTTNPIEGVHRQIRKITKTKGAFSSEQALLKLMYLVIRNISRKWTMPMQNWGMVFSQLYIKFGERLLKEGI